MPFPKPISISLRLQVNKMSNTEPALCSSCYYIKCYRIWRLQPQWRSNTFQCESEDHGLETKRKLNTLAKVNTKGSAGGSAFGYITEFVNEANSVSVCLNRLMKSKWRDAPSRHSADVTSMIPSVVFSPIILSLTQRHTDKPASCSRPLSSYWAKLICSFTPHIIPLRNHYIRADEMLTKARCLS